MDYKEQIAQLNTYADILRKCHDDESHDISDLMIAQAMENAALTIKTLTDKLPNN